MIARLRRRLAQLPGAPTFLQPVQDLRIGGMASAALYQFTLRGENLEELNTWGPKVLQKLRTLPQLRDVNSDQQDKGLQSSLVIDRDTAYRLGLTAQLIDDTLYDAFGQRQVAITYTPLNQYHVVMEVAPPFWQRPETLRQIYVHSSRGFEVPLSAFTQYKSTNAPLSVNHLGQFPAVTISFNLGRGGGPGGCGDGHRVGHPGDGAAGQHPGELPGNCRGLQGLAGQRTLPDPGGPPGGLHRPGGALRELHPPHHHPLHPALGGGGSPHCPDAQRDGVEPHRRHRHHPAHRHRQEKRHHDGGLCPAGGAPRRPEVPRRRSMRPVCCASAPS